MIFVYIFGGLSAVCFLMAFIDSNAAGNENAARFMMSIWLASALSNAFFAFVCWSLSEIVNKLNATSLIASNTLRVNKDLLEVNKSLLELTKKPDGSATKEKIPDELRSPIMRPSSKQKPSPTTKGDEQIIILNNGRITPKPNGSVSISTNRGERSFQTIAAAKKFLISKEIN